MAWFTHAELQLRMGARAFVECLDDDRDGRADEDAVDALIADAEEFVRMYVAELGAAFGVTTPTPRLKTLAITVAIQRAYERRPEFFQDGRSPCWRAFEAAKKDLEDISRGILRIGPTMADSPTPSPSVGSSTVSAGTPALVSYDTDDTDPNCCC